MQDEHFFREWNNSHARFSTELDRLINKLFVHRTRTHGIGKPYGSEIPASHDPLRAATSSLASGLAAVITTLALFVTVGALAMPVSAETSAEIAFAAVLNEGLLL